MSVVPGNGDGVLVGASPQKAPEDATYGRGSAAPAATPLYFVNGWWDGAVIGGLSILLFAVLRLSWNGPRTPAVIEAAIVLTFFVNYPHFSATIYRLYQNPANIREFPVTAMAMPALMIAGIGASLLQPELVAPYFVLLFLLWSPYHYSGQTIGITMIYARRSAFAIGPLERLSLSGFVFSTFVLSFAQHSNNGPVTYFGMVIPHFKFPDWFTMGVGLVMAASAAAFLAVAVRWCLRHRTVLPPIVLLPAAAQFVWFLPGAETPTFYEFVPLFHSLQYLYIAWVMQIGLRLSQPNVQRSWQSIAAETLRWLIPNYVGGFILFVGLPWALMLWVELPMLAVAGIVIAAINIHHFFVDGVIWKLRDAPQSSPLMMNIAQLAIPTPEPRG